MPAPDFTLTDQAGEPWTLAEHTPGAAHLLLFLRGDWWPYCNGQLVSLASQYDELLGAGARLVAIDIDSPGQHAAMVEKLDLPFPYLSDPDRRGAIAPYDLADPVDERNLAIPALVLIDRSGDEVWRWAARDFADRIPEAEVLEQVRSLGLDAVSAEPMRNGTPEPGPKAMPVRAMSSYFRGARFASVAFYRRMREIPEAREAAKAEMLAYVDEMDRYIAAVADLRERTGQ